MGYQLRRWLADRLPDGLSSGERLVALEIADQANEQTRRAYGTSVLQAVIRRTGYANTHQLGKVLGKLGANGIELRVPVRDRQGKVVVDKKDRTVYACNGHELNFYVPLAEECPALKVTQAGDQTASGSSPAGVTKEPEGPPPGHEGPPPGEERSPAWSPKVTQVGGPSPQTPQENSSSLLRSAGRAAATDAPPEEREEDPQEQNPEVPSVPGVPPTLVAEVMQETEATAEELLRILADARRAGIQTPGPWLRSKRGAEDFRQRLADLRAGRSAAAPTPIAPPVHEVLAAARGPEVPQPRDDQPPPDPGQSIAAARDRLLKLSPAAARRTFPAPAPAARPDEPDPAVQAAHAYLAGRGDAFDHLTAAREKLGDDAPREEVVILAAELAGADRGAVYPTG